MHPFILLHIKAILFGILGKFIFVCFSLFWFNARVWGIIIVIVFEFLRSHVAALLCFGLGVVICTCRFCGKVRSVMHALGLVARLVHLVILWWTPGSSCRAVHSASLKFCRSCLSSCGRHCMSSFLDWVVGLHGRWTSRSIMLMGVLGQQARLVGLESCSWHPHI